MLLHFLQQIFSKSKMGNRTCVLLRGILVGAFSGHFSCNLAFVGGCISPWDLCHSSGVVYQHQHPAGRNRTGAKHCARLKEGVLAATSGVGAEEQSHKMHVY